MKEWEDRNTTYTACGALFSSFTDWLAFWVPPLVLGGLQGATLPDIVCVVFTALSWRWVGKGKQKGREKLSRQNFFSLTKTAAVKDLGSHFTRPAFFYYLRSQLCQPAAQCLRETQPYRNNWSWNLLGSHLVLHVALLDGSRCGKTFISGRLDT